MKSSVSILAHLARANFLQRCANRNENSECVCLNKIKLILDSKFVVFRGIAVRILFPVAGQCFHNF